MNTNNDYQPGEADLRAVAEDAYFAAIEAGQSPDEAAWAQAYAVEAYIAATTPELKEAA